jgi:hypothetical protein
MLIAIFLVSVVFSLNIYGQKGTISVTLGPSGSFVLANQNFSYYYKNGMGGIVQASFGVSKLGSVIANYSYYKIGTRHSTTGNMKLNCLKLGFHSFFSNSMFFFQADGGLVFNGDDKNFIVGISPGYSLKLSQKSSIDFFPSINQVFGNSSNTWLFANIGYRLKLK